MRQATVNTADWWTAEAAKKAVVSVGGLQSPARVLPSSDWAQQVQLPEIKQLCGGALGLITAFGLLYLFEKKKNKSRLHPNEEVDMCHKNVIQGGLV